MIRNMTMSPMTFQMKLNEWGFRPPIGSTGPGEPPEDGEVNEKTLPSRHMIRNSSPGSQRPSTLPSK